MTFQSVHQRLRYKPTALEMTKSEHDYSCPLGAVDRRLADVHRHWHDAERAYFDPDDFRISIQTAIQTLRTVTFILQSKKKLFDNFDSWYDAWQEKLRGDPLMRWMVDARNKIEKQGDLDSHSFVRAEVTASYYDEGPRVETLAELFQSTDDLIKSIPTELLRQHVFRNGFIRIQRRWVENSLPDLELLDAVGIAFGKIAKLLADAHIQLGLDPPSTMIGDIDHTQGVEARGGRLPCMIGHSEARTINIWLATGERMEVETKAVTVDKEKAEIATSMYGIDPKAMFRSIEKTPTSTLNDLFVTARRMFYVDGQHDTIAFLLDGERILSLTQLAIQSHGEKYIVMRSLANQVISKGANGLILISEAWSAPYDANDPYRRAVDSTERTEFLTATLVTKTGEPVQLSALIERNDGVVSLGETQMLLNQAQIAFAPIYSAWGRQVPKAWIDMLSEKPNSNA